MSVVRIERTIAATPERVYRAWLDPATMNRWAAPVTWNATDASVEERVGGHYRATHLDADGNDAGGFEAEILELIPNERIVLAWEFVGPGRESLGADARSRLTVVLKPAPDGKTALTLVHDRLDTPNGTDGVREGWTGTVGRFADVVEEFPDPEGDR